MQFKKCLFRIIVQLDFLNKSRYKEVTATQFASFHAICTESLLPKLSLNTDHEHVFRMCMKESWFGINKFLSSFPENKSFWQRCHNCIELTTVSLYSKTKANKHLMVFNQKSYHYITKIDACCISMQVFIILSSFESVHFNRLCI